MHDHTDKFSHAAGTALQAGLLGLSLVLLLSPADRTPMLRWAFNGAFFLECAVVTWRVHRRGLLNRTPEDVMRAVLESQRRITTGWLERVAIPAGVITFFVLALS